MSTVVFNEEFLNTLVKIKNAYGLASDVSKPVADLNTLIAICESQIRRSNLDGALYDSCNNDLVKFMYVTIVVIKNRLIERNWDGRRKSDWMYLLSKEIWALNAAKNSFGPVKFPDESQEYWEQRRARGARNTLSKVKSLIDTVDNCLEACNAMILDDSITTTIGISQALLEESTLGLSCGMIAKRVGQLAKGQITRIESIQKALEDLYEALDSIGRSA